MHALSTVSVDIGDIAYPFTRWRKIFLIVVVKEKSFVFDNHQISRYRP